MKATLKAPVQLAGTNLSLPAGATVHATPAGNIPQSEGKFFVRPLFGKWPDGIRRNLSDCILVSSDEIKVEESPKMRAKLALYDALETLRAPGCLNTGAEIYRLLRRLEPRAQRAANAYVSGFPFEGIPARGFTYRHLEEFKEKAIFPAIKAVFGRIPAGFFFNDDPRGHALKLDAEKVEIPAGMPRDMGGDGILAYDF